MLDLKRLLTFKSKEYRDSYLDTAVRSGVSYQVRALRAKDGLTQIAFARSVGKPQSVISRLENSEYGKVTVQTLLDIAKGRDVALVVRFVDYPTFFGSINRMNEEELQPDSIYESIDKATENAISNKNDKYVIKDYSTSSSHFAFNSLELESEVKIFSIDNISNTREYLDVK